METGLGEAPLGPVTAPLHCGGLILRQVRWEHNFSVYLQVLHAANKALLAMCVVGH